MTNCSERDMPLRRFLLVPVLASWPQPRGETARAHSPHGGECARPLGLSAHCGGGRGGSGWARRPFYDVVTRVSGGHGDASAAGAPQRGLLVAPVLRGTGALTTRPAHSSTRAPLTRASLHRLGLRVGGARKPLSASLPANLPEEVASLAGERIINPHAWPLP